MVRRTPEKKPAVTPEATPKSTETPAVLSEATDKTVVVTAAPVTHEPPKTEGIEDTQVGDPQAPEPEKADPELLGYRIQTMLDRRKEAPKEAPAPTTNLPAEAQKKVDELINEGNMAEAMKMIQTETAKQIIQSVRSSSAQETTEREWQKGREEAAAEVYKRHPELLEYDEMIAAGKPAPAPTPLLLELQRVYREYPSILHDAKGPLLALETAEATLQKKAAMKAAPTERSMQRTAAATAASVVGSGAAPAPSPVSTPKLNDEEKFIAFTLGLSEEAYAKTKTPTQKGRQGGHVVHTSDYYKRRQVPMNRGRIGG